MKNETTDLAIAMHDAYETFAKEEGWKTQTPISWTFLPDANKRVMLKMAERILGTIKAQRLADAKWLKEQGHPGAGNILKRRILSRGT